MKAIARPLNSSAGDWLVSELGNTRWTSFRACVAYLKQSGSKHVASDLHAFSRRPGARARVAVGVSTQGTSLEGVQDFWRVLNGYGDFYIVHEGSGGLGSFHPKGYLFSNATTARVLVGSANLTEGGLFTNHELSVALDLDLSDAPAAAFFAEVSAAFDAWQTPSANCLEVVPSLIQTLYDRGDLPSEATLRIVGRAASAARRSAAGAAAVKPPNAFGASLKVQAPQPKAMPTGIAAAPVIVLATTPVPVTPPAATPMAVARVATTPPTLSRGVVTGAAGARQFFIEVRPHPNGELFLSYTAVNHDPNFFEYPFTGWTTPKRAANKPYPQFTPDPVVEILIYDGKGRVLRQKSAHALNVVDYDPKHEIRVTIPDGMHREIPEMSVLVMTKDPTAALDYRMEFYPPGTAPGNVLANLTEVLPSGGVKPPRRYGWS